MIHYDGEQNFNKTNKWRLPSIWKQTVIAYYWLSGSSIWEAVTKITQGDFDPTIQERDDHMGFMLGHLFCHIPYSVYPLNLRCKEGLAPISVPSNVFVNMFKWCTAPPLSHFAPLFTVSQVRIFFHCCLGAKISNLGVGCVLLEISVDGGCCMLE